MELPDYRGVVVGTFSLVMSSKRDVPGACNIRLPHGYLKPTALPEDLYSFYHSSRTWAELLRAYFLLMYVAQFYPLPSLEPLTVIYSTG